MSIDDCIAKGIESLEFCGTSLPEMEESEEVSDYLLKIEMKLRMLVPSMLKSSPEPKCLASESHCPFTKHEKHMIGHFYLGPITSNIWGWQWRWKCVACYYEYKT